MGKRRSASVAHWAAWCNVSRYTWEYRIQPKFIFMHFNWSTSQRTNNEIAIELTMITCPAFNSSTTKDKHRKTVDMWRMNGLDLKTPTKKILAKIHTNTHTRELCVLFRPGFDLIEFCKWKQSKATGFKWVLYWISTRNSSQSFVCILGHHSIQATGREMWKSTNFQLNF